MANTKPIDRVQTSPHLTLPALARGLADIRKRLLELETRITALEEKAAS